MAEDLQQEQAPEVVVLPGNCAGELEALPGVEGVTHTQYKCTICGAIVHVGHEELEASGLPTQHARPEEDK